MSGSSLVRLVARRACALEHADRSLVEEVVLGVAALGVAGQGEDGIALGLDPVALGGDEGAARGEQVGAVEGERQQAGHDRDEKPIRLPRAGPGQDGGEERSQ
jgi:hypothetical protein